MNKTYPTDITAIVYFFETIKTYLNITYALSQLPNTGRLPPWTPALAGEANKYHQKWLG